MKNLTPEHMRCNLTVSCPSVYELVDGRLLIVGLVASRYEYGLPSDKHSEAAIIIDRALLSEVLRDTPVT